MDQPFAQPQFVMMPIAQRNTLGVFGFFVALVGLFVPTGVVAVLGLVLCLAAIGRAPRGFATCGVVLGLLGTLFWASAMLVALVVGLVAVVLGAIFLTGAFVLTQPEVVELTSDMVTVAIAVKEHQHEHDRLPDELAALSLGSATTIDPWGAAYRLTPVPDDDPGFDVISAGADGAFETEDDVRLSGLDRLWETAFDSFDTKVEELGERLEALDGGGHHAASWRGCPLGPCGQEAGTYERRARRQIADEAPGEPPTPDASTGGDESAEAEGPAAEPAVRRIDPHG